jgi:hypothetical protein
MRDANFNLLLEVASLALFFLFLAFFVVFAIIAANIVFIEVEGEEPTEVMEAAAYSPRGYLLAFLIFTVPAIVVVLAGLGIRVLLVRPDPPGSATTPELQIRYPSPATSDRSPPPAARSSGRKLSSP